MQRELAGKSCELSAAHLDLHCWKRKVALQQLRLVSIQEDCGHQQVHVDALTAECSRRQEECNSLQDDLQIAYAQTTQLEARLAANVATSADLQVNDVLATTGTDRYCPCTGYKGCHIMGAKLNHVVLTAEAAGTAAGSFARQGEPVACLTDQAAGISGQAGSS